ncbi:solute carrier family 45 member 3-like [Oratosquilla oratoria]|uniref:solute carrier family 45 member 3-like n=1 Tax=Oratosquilla oratoria TaxID=337810 RepID=UPI003F76E968
MAVTPLLPGPTHGEPAEKNKTNVSERDGRRPRGILHLMGINAVVCGIEMVSSAAFTYIPPLLLKAGFTETHMSIILGVAPFFDLLTVPHLAEWSDSCTSPLGRRRPFIVALSFIVMFSLILIPYGPSIGVLQHSKGLSMLVLAVGVIMLDYSYQALFNPCESLISDLMATSPKSEEPLGFMVYSASLSLGCILGYLIVAIDWTSVGFIRSSQEQTVFSVIFIFFLPCLFLTLVFAKEKSLKRTENIDVVPIVHDDSSMLKENRICISPTNKFRVTQELVLDLSKDNTSIVRDQPSDGGYESGSSDPDESVIVNMSSTDRFLWRYQRFALLLHKNSQVSTYCVVSTILRLIIKLIVMILLLPYKILRLPVHAWQLLHKAPAVLKRLFLAELFGWMGFMCHNMFFTDFVGQYVYGGSPDAPEGSPVASLYDQGVRMGSWGLFLHSLTACVYSFFIQPFFIGYMGPRNVFVGGLVIFAFSMMATTVSPSVVFLNVVTAISGIGFAALTSTPNLLVTLYNSNRPLYYWDGGSKMMHQEVVGLGRDVALLDMAYFLAQIFLSLSMGPLVDLTGSALPYMVVAALSGLAAVYCSTHVVFEERQLLLLKNGQF